MPVNIQTVMTTKQMHVYTEVRARDMGLNHQNTRVVTTQSV